MNEGCGMHFWWRIRLQVAWRDCQPADHWHNAVFRAGPHPFTSAHNRKHPFHQHKAVSVALPAPLSH